MSLDGKTVLLVEDNEDDVFLMRRLLKKAGIATSLEIATDGRQAISYLEGSGVYTDRLRYPLPELVFLDLKLPFLHGFEVMAWIRRQSPLLSLPVIILTSSLEDRDREQAQAFGVPFLIKPPSVAMVQDAIVIAENRSS
jgi:CheY-like chemotaxis protein